MFPVAALAILPAQRRVLGSVVKDDVLVPNKNRAMPRAAILVLVCAGYLVSAAPRPWQCSQGRCFGAHRNAPSGSSKGVPKRAPYGFIYLAPASDVY